MEKLDSSQVHLWLAYPAQIAEPRLLAEYQSLLSESELQKQARFHFERDRHRYLVTRAMVRTVLSKYADLAPQDWRFTSNAYGKPSIAAGHACARGIEFNVAHTDGLIVLGVACERALGVDVENIRNRQVDIGIADRYFAPSETRALHALSQERQLQRFFEYWTLKESYIKARGLGLTLPLDRFAFDLDGCAGITLTVHPCLGDLAERWVCWHVPLAGKYLAAICVERCRREPQLLLPYSWP